MTKECPNCKAIGKNRRLRYTTESDSRTRRAYYKCDRCGFKVKA